MASTFEGPGAPPALEDGAILGFGNPLLDLLADVEDSVLEKWGVKAGEAILAEDKHLPLYDDLVKTHEVVFEAGGATLNAIRVAAWLSRSSNGCTFSGSVGKDSFADQLQEACGRAGVTTLMYTEGGKPTGACAVLVDKEKERSLITRLEAANEYPLAHAESAAVKSAIERAKVIYSASFFLTVPEGPKSMLVAAKHAAANNRIYALNLSAEFLINFFADPMNEVLPYADYVFGNETEAAAFGEKNGWGKDLTTVALRLAALPKASGARPRIVVFSQGADPTIVACNGKVTMYPVPPLDKSLLVDTNGAGDAFVGGFLARLAADQPIDECVRSGHYAARVVIQRGGCTLPPQPDI